MDSSQRSLGGEWPGLVRGSRRLFKECVQSVIMDALVAEMIQRDWLSETSRERDRDPTR